MIYPEHLEKEVLRYCEISKIPVRNGVIPPFYIPEIKRFLRVKQKIDISLNRAEEERNRLSLTGEAKKYIKEAVESPIEEFMLMAIYKHGLEKHCRPQFKIGTKRVDIAFPIAKLVVECDGRKYHFLDQEQIERDQKRDVYLAKKGWMVKHFDGLIIRRNIDICIKEIKEYLNPYLGLMQ